MTRPDPEAADIRSSTAPRAWAKGARVARLLELMPELATDSSCWPRPATPPTIHCIDTLPKTSSGKTQRYLLRNRRRTELAAPVPC
jgi:acyl-coenzyme A synthetase/AMP-(fatty) acid ligase